MTIPFSHRTVRLLAKLDIDIEPMEMLMDRAQSWQESGVYADKQTHKVDEADFSLADLEVLESRLIEVGDTKLAKAVAGIAQVRRGVSGLRIPNAPAAKPILEAFIRKHALRGWVFFDRGDGYSYPELITGISYSPADLQRDSAAVDEFVVHSVFFSPVDRSRTYSSRAPGVHSMHRRLRPGDVSRKTAEQVFADMGGRAATVGMVRTHMRHVTAYRDHIEGGFAKQFIGAGAAHSKVGDEYGKDFVSLDGHKLIFDIEPTDLPSFEVDLSGLEEGADPGADKGAEVSQAEDMDGGAGFDPEGAPPVHPLAKVFDLRLGEFFYVHVNAIKRYQYDKTLKDKLILPASHREMLDDLTGSLGDFTEDIVAGKSAGNLIICRGQPGLGKTLTAEVYAEIMEVPLYSLHAASLGMSAEDIRAQLEVVFQRSKRWGVVLLLDEADVFISKRNGDREKDMIVAEFLRTVEYFDGLIFMTTNRVDEIDEAMLQRAIAIIDYSYLQGEQRKQVWRVMAENFGINLTEALIDELDAMFTQIAQRDVKNLLSLVLRTAKRRGCELDANLFRNRAVFRAIKISEPS